MISRFLVALVLVASVDLSQHAAAATGAALIAKTPAEARSPNDAQIERNIKIRLARSKLSADHFTFSVSQGVATIEGSTDVMQHKGVMTRMAKASGATSVRNNIRVSDAAKAKAAVALAKGRLSKRQRDLPAPVSSGSPSSVATSTSAPVAPTPVPIPRATVLPLRQPR